VLVLAGCGGGGTPPAQVPGGGAPPEGADPEDRRLDADPPGSALSIFPEVAGSGDRVYVTWYDRRHGAMDVFFRRSLDGGRTWGPTDLRLDTDPPGSAESSVPRIACSGDDAHVVWADRRAGPSQIRYQRSSDAGATWLAEDLRLDTGPVQGSSSPARITASGERVYVVWADARHGETDVLFQRSLDGGRTWLPGPVRLDTDPAGEAPSEGPVPFAEGDLVCVAWIDGRDGEADVRVNRSLDAGTTWLESDLRLDTDPPGASASTAAAIAGAGMRVAVVWRDERDGGAGVRANRSLDGGLTWLREDVLVGGDPAGRGDAQRPQVACEGDAVHVVWEDARDGRPDVRYARSTDAGASFATDERLDRDPPGTGTSFLPRLAVDGPNVHVVWYDDRAGRFDVLLNRSADGGATWLAAEIRLDQDERGSAHSLAPALVVAGGEARVVWFDERNGLGDVYFNRAR
jgi:hypothetical protein